ncbi:TetR/AcrR family transcriptional regulator [Quadrisphaera sp. INWT6]|uniref:TetR/AcrR family transcriptional regulator n=1 Tax=Quadrisphaera sp. INWT6 TaxID=2596917 RepID=UPI00189227F6|nr:TetR/AcrR family transcriptional regulator [Quadrisphaera sp. INWT6]MBF5082632.1 TetR/AcrR family transcriptional regulator [Quadrisphaera sp. INWT6]
MTLETGAPTGRDAVRARLVDVAAQLLHERGPAAVTTRAVAAAAGVQAPTIYRVFGDKDGLLDAVAERAADDFVAAKAGAARDEAGRGTDPVDDLRTAFSDQVDFGVANPEVFRLLGDPARVLRSGAARAGREVLRARVHRVALAGRLRVPEERCVDVVQSAGTGVIQTLLATPAPERDPQLAAAVWDAVATAILVPAADGGQRGTTTAEHSSAATTLIAFRALAPQLPALSDAERALLVEWLDRPEVSGPR